jgi:NAD(P)-dependent dehydrogenase (short-subunit alcohol dehydrogenase family)
MQRVDGRIALVTGASRGIGRGVAEALASAGATVFGTGRTIASASLSAAIRRLPCDHTDDAAVAAAFQTILGEAGQLDILVNSAWGGYQHMVENGRFTWPAPFWEQSPQRWHDMVTAGVRAAFIASQHAARVMVPARRGLIVNLSYWSAQKYLGNALYGLAKAATDKLSADMGHDLASSGVTAVSLYPGLVRTEAVVAAGVFDLSNSESPEFIGRAVAALASDPAVGRWNGKVVIAAALAAEYGFTDVDGRQPRPLSVGEP